MKTGYRRETSVPATLIINGIHYNVLIRSIERLLCEDTYDETYGIDGRRTGYKMVEETKDIIVCETIPNFTAIKH